MNDGLEEIVAYFEALARYLPARTEKEGGESGKEKLLGN
jgi:hypothetical protein